MRASYETTPESASLPAGPDTGMWDAGGSALWRIDRDPGGALRPRAPVRPVSLERDLDSPVRSLASGRGGPVTAALDDYEAWWRTEGVAVSATVDRGGTPRLRMYDRLGRRVDAIDWPAGYDRMLGRGYAEGVVAEAARSGSLLPGYRLGYITSFFDPGVYCPYTVSLGTLVPLLKYAPETAAGWIDRLTRRDESVWQGATWMTEAGGGSDLGHGVETRAVPGDDGWRLTGEKYFASNAGAELAVVGARPDGAPAGIHGLGLFALPRRRSDGGLNYRIRRLKDKIATRSVATGEIELAGSEAIRLDADDGHGIYLIMEVLNTSRIANSVGSVALLQRALAEARAHARDRIVFGRPLLEQPLFRRELDDWLEALARADALAWAAARELDAVWLEQPPYSPRYHRCRLLAHLAKYWTAELAIRGARWAIEAHGGNGAIVDFGVERLLREALVLSIWEGTRHRQILDALAAMERAAAHEALFEWLGEPAGTDARRAAIAGLLAAGRDEREARGGTELPMLADWVAARLREAQ